jgi:hypothetical protein
MFSWTKLKFIWTATCRGACSFVYAWAEADILSTSSDASKYFIFIVRFLDCRVKRPWNRSLGSVVRSQPIGARSCSRNDTRVLVRLAPIYQSFEQLRPREPCLALAVVAAELPDFLKMH